MYFRVNEKLIYVIDTTFGINESIFSGNEQQKVYKLFLFSSEAGKFKICNQQQRKKNGCEYCHSLQWNYQKMLKRLKFFQNFKDGLRRRTFSKRVLFPWRSGNLWYRNWNRHHRVPYTKQLTNRASLGSYCHDRGPIFPSTTWSSSVSKPLVLHTPL